MPGGTQMLKIGICDDEIMCRDEIRNICKDYYQHNYHVEEFTNGEKLIEYIEQGSLDIIFLDIEMGGRNGIEIKNYLEAKGMDCFIIFITSHKEFVMNAFGKNVMGYIDKPVNKEEIYRILDRIKLYDAQFQKIEIEESKGKTKIIQSDKIKYIRADHVYTELVFDNDETVWVRKSLNEWEKILSDVCFYRIQKSYIVNLAYVEKIEIFVQLEGDVSLKVGRGKIKDLKAARKEYIRKMARRI